MVEPVKARKRKAEHMAEQGQQPPSKRAGTVYRWTPAALASYESSTMQGGEHGSGTGAPDRQHVRPTFSTFCADL